MKKLYLIGGPMGVGKTTVCQQLKRDLPRSVCLDGDWCWDADPFVVTEETKAMVLDNICYLLNNFLHCSAYEHIIFGWVMHEQAILDAIQSRLDMENAEVYAVSLLADEKNLRSRLKKDVDAGKRREDVIERSLARLAGYSILDTVKIDTNGKSVREVADAIRDL